MSMSKITNEKEIKVENTAMARKNPQKSVFGSVYACIS
jgi:hypothetical protein